MSTSPVVPMLLTLFTSVVLNIFLTMRRFESERSTTGPLKLLVFSALHAIMWVFTAVVFYEIFYVVIPLMPISLQEQNAYAIDHIDFIRGLLVWLVGITAVVHIVSILVLIIKKSKVVFWVLGSICIDIAGWAITNQVLDSIALELTNN